MGFPTLVVQRAKIADVGPHPLPFFLPYIVPFVTVLAHYSSTPWHALLPPLFVWIIVPIIDTIISKHSSSSRTPLSHVQKRHLDAQFSFRLAVYLWPPTQFLLLVWAAHRVSTVSMPTVRLIGLLSSIGLTAAEGVNCSHELLHRRSKFERLLADLLLCSVFYGHFSIEHARGHHFNVATPNDPATLRFGESFYTFLPRTIIGGYLSACRLEYQRLTSLKRRFLSVHNHILYYAVLQMVFPLAFALVFGSWAVALFFFQAGCAVMLLEQVNAIEHYGLLREKRADGSYERVGPRHSWDAPQSASSYLLFKLQLHADHHLRTSLLHFFFLFCILTVSWFSSRPQELYSNAYFIHPME